MGRKQIPVDEKLLKTLTQYHLSDRIICDILGISEDTLNRRFAEKMNQWRSESKSKIASVLYDEGINKREPWALKALAQKHLDYHDKVKTETTNVNASMEKLSDDQLEAEIQRRLESK